MAKITMGSVSKEVVPTPAQWVEAKQLQEKVDNFAPSLQEAHKKADEVALLSQQTQTKVTSNEKKLGDLETLTQNQGKKLGDLDTLSKGNKDKIDILSGINTYNSTYEYNADDSVKKITLKDADNNIVESTSFTYLSNGDVDTSTLTKNGISITTKYTYDAKGNVIGSINTKVVS